jgi:glycosyltransferase involved in cell wall biosynthesis
MRIVIPCDRITGKFKGGISWYKYNLIKYLAKIDKENTYILYDFKSRNFRQEYEYFKSYLPEQENFHKRFIRFHHSLAYRFQKRFLPAEIFTGRMDIIHLPHPADILTIKAKRIVTVHDIIPLLPESENWDFASKRKRQANTIKKYILKADRIIAISQHTKNDILKYFDVSPSKINVIPQGKSDIFSPSDDRDTEKEVLTRYGISGKYLLFTGTVSPRKNLVRLISSFEKIKKKFREYKLVIVGKKGWFYKDILGRIEKLSGTVRDDIIITEYVPLTDLPYLYSDAAVFILPSLYEGFGLPVLEAMACGCPVITSNISSMPEVAGDAAVLVNPYSVEEIASVIEKVLSDERLRASMRNKGLERAKQFSWEKTAGETLQVYEETYAEGK